MVWWYIISRAQIYNGLWPTTPSNLVMAWITIAAMLYIDNQYITVITGKLWALGNFIYLDSSYPQIPRILVISLLTAIGFFVIVLYTRRYMLRILLSYRGWMCKYNVTCIFTVIICHCSQIIEGKCFSSFEAKHIHVWQKKQFAPWGKILFSH